MEPLTSRWPGLHRLLCVLILTTMPAILPARAATASVSSPFTITSSPSFALAPVVSGKLVVWLQARKDHHSPLRHVALGDVYGKDLRSGKLMRITAHATAVTDSPAPEGLAGQVTASNTVVVWTDCRRCRDVEGLGGVVGADMYAKYLPSGRETRLPRAYAATVAGRTVFWVDCCGNRRHLYATDAESGRTRLLIHDTYPKSPPSADGHTVVWIERRGNNWDIYGKDIQSGVRFMVARRLGADLSDLKISGSLVIWTRQGTPDGSAVIEARNLRTGRTQRIARIPQKRYLGWIGPRTALSGSIVVWEQARHDLGPHGGNFDILGEDLTTGQRMRIAASGRDELSPSISGKTVVWQSVAMNRRTDFIQDSRIEGLFLP